MLILREISKNFWSIFEGSLIPFFWERNITRLLILCIFCYPRIFGITWDTISYAAWDFASLGKLAKRRHLKYKRHLDLWNNKLGANDAWNSPHPVTLLGTLQSSLFHPSASPLDLWQSFPSQHAWRASRRACHLRLAWSSRASSFCWFLS